MDYDPTILVGCNTRESFVYCRDTSTVGAQISKEAPRSHYTANRYELTRLQILNRKEP